MKIPNFSAEAALYRTSTHYQMFGTAIQAKGSIHPASFRSPSFSCAMICDACEAVGGICIHLGNGRCACY